MLLTITTTHFPATDLGYLLHKNPARVQTLPLAFGTAHVFYPEARAERTTVALVVEVDPVGLVRDRGGADRPLEPYVNDRPYAASSFLSVALHEAFATALAGRSRERPELATQKLPLEATISALPCRGGRAVLERLFLPLGYALETEGDDLDALYPEWGTSPYHRVTLRGHQRLADLLAHLYVLIPVLDDDKHYWVGNDEVDKLLRHGRDWLAAHPEKDLISLRYLKHRKGLANKALERLLDDEGGDDPDVVAQADDAAEQAIIEKPMSLDAERRARVLAVLEESQCRRVVDLGCGEGRLLGALLAKKQFDHIVGVDVSHRALEIASERLRLAELPEAKRARITLLHGSLFYRDQRLKDFDAATCVEVIEHLEPDRLAFFAKNLFGLIRAPLVIVTTPNSEYNVRFETLPAGKLRHHDHRFEWTRGQLAAWADGTAAAFDYKVEILGVGPEDSDLGCPTQMAVFRRIG